MFKNENELWLYTEIKELFGDDDVIQIYNERQMGYDTCGDRLAQPMVH